MFIYPYLRNIDSMRRVTAKPAYPSLRTNKSERQWRRDLHQCTDGNDAADRIGHAHQRSMQRGGDIPHHHVTDETREHKHSEVSKERCRRIGTDEQEQQRSNSEQDGRLSGRCRSATMTMRRSRHSFDGSSRFGRG
jgi:hypothetical protein